METVQIQISAEPKSEVQKTSIKGSVMKSIDIKSLLIGICYICIIISSFLSSCSGRQKKTNPKFSRGDVVIRTIKMRDGSFKTGPMHLTRIDADGYQAWEWTDEKPTHFPDGNRIPESSAKKETVKIEQTKDPKLAVDACGKPIKKEQEYLYENYLKNDGTTGRRETKIKAPPRQLLSNSYYNCRKPAGYSDPGNLCHGFYINCLYGGEIMTCSMPGCLDPRALQKPKK